MPRINLYPGSPDDDLPTPGRFFNFIPKSSPRSYLSSVVGAPSVINENTKNTHHPFKKPRINLYSGSPDDDLPTPAYLSGTRSYAVLHFGRDF